MNSYLTANVVIGTCTHIRKINPTQIESIYGSAEVEPTAFLIM